MAQLAARLSRLAPCTLFGSAQAQGLARLKCMAPSSSSSSSWNLGARGICSAGYRPTLQQACPGCFSPLLHSRPPAQVRLQLRASQRPPASLSPQGPRHLSSFSPPWTHMRSRQQQQQASFSSNSSDYCFRKEDGPAAAGPPGADAAAGGAAKAAGGGPEASTGAGADDAGKGQGQPGGAEKASRVMLLAKAWYFLQGASGVFILPYLNIYLSQRGLSSSQIGLLAALRPWISAPLGMAASAAADKRRAHNQLLLGAIGAATLLRAGLPLSEGIAVIFAQLVLAEVMAAAANMIGDATVLSNCKTDGDFGHQRLWAAIGWGGCSLLTGPLISHFGLEASFATFGLLSLPLLYVAHNISYKYPAGAAAAPAGQQAPSAAASGGGGAAAAPAKEQQQQQVGQVEGRPMHAAADLPAPNEPWMGSLELPDDWPLDQQQHHLKQRQQQRYQQQKQGLHAAGTRRASAATAAAAAADGHNLRGDGSKLRPATAHAASSSSSSDSDSANTSSRGAAGAGGHASGNPEAAAGAAAAGGAAPPSAGLRQLLAEPSVLLFLWRCMVMGFGLGVLGTYEFLYLKQLGAPETLIGLALLVSCCTEVPAFRFQGLLLKHVSIPNMINIVLLTISLRLACYAVLPAVTGSVWSVLPVELLHGITFACGFGAAAVHAKKIAPPGLEATMQGVFQAAYLGVGVGLGGLVGGLLMESLGGQALFTHTSLMVLGGAAAGLLAEHTLLGFLQQRRRRGPKAKLA